MAYKICKNCGAKNDIDEVFCSECMETEFEEVVDDSLNENSIEEKKIQTNKTTLEKQSILRFNANNFVITIHDKSVILGRENYGSEYLSQFNTVSRSHLKVIYSLNSWYIEDLNSTNGTYLNGIKIEPNKKYKINNDDKIKLSSKLSLIVELE